MVEQEGVLWTVRGGLSSGITFPVSAGEMYLPVATNGALQGARTTIGRTECLESAVINVNVQLKKYFPSAFRPAGLKTLEVSDAYTR